MTLGRTMVFTYVNPVVAVVAGAIVLNGPVTVTTMVSFGLILVGSVLATARAAGVRPLSRPSREVPDRVR
jgi:drug/metabolite transporter (DMT)-like permease